MQTITLKKGDKFLVSIKNPEMHVTAVNVLINGEHKQYSMNQRLHCQYGPVEKGKQIKMVIHADDGKEYSFSSYVCYGSMTKDDPNKYICLPEEFIHDEYKVLESFEISIKEDNAKEAA